MNKKVLLISGYKRSGKDTVANYLIDTKNFSKVSFAASLKDLTANEFNIERNILDDQFCCFRLHSVNEIEWRNIALLF